MDSGPHRFTHDALAELGEVDPIDIAQIDEVGVNVRVEFEPDILAFDAHARLRAAWARVLRARTRPLVIEVQP